MVLGKSVFAAEKSLTILALERKGFVSAAALALHF